MGLAIGDITVEVRGALMEGAIDLEEGATMAEVPAPAPHPSPAPDPFALALAPELAPELMREPRGWK